MTIEELVEWLDGGNTLNPGGYQFGPLVPKPQYRLHRGCSVAHPGAMLGTFSHVYVPIIIDAVMGMTSEATNHQRVWPHFSPFVPLPGHAVLAIGVLPLNDYFGIVHLYHTTFQGAGFTAANLQKCLIDHNYVHPHVQEILMGSNLVPLSYVQLIAVSYAPAT